jgi:hypothetical protein
VECDIGPNPDFHLEIISKGSHYIICGPEFGVESEGKVALIHRPFTMESPLEETSEFT